MTYRKLTVLLLLAVLPLSVFCQSKPTVFFKQGDTLRLRSNSKKHIDTTLTIVVPKNKDSTDKHNIIKQDSILKGKLVVEVDRKNSTLLASAALAASVKLPLNNEFDLDSLKQQKEFTYAVSVPRDLQDDKTLVLLLHVKNAAGKEIDSPFKKLVIYIKPFAEDSLTQGRNYELWFLTGTNFDLFDGVKAQEFFFRSNAFFKISGNFYGQVAFYKNRYYTLDTSSGSLPFSSIQRPTLGDSLYTMTSGNYRRTTKQTIDPLALQLDVLYKLTDHTESNFFVTAGLDYSTIAVSINNKYEVLDTSFYLRTSRPDTVKGYNNYGTTVFPQSISYKKPNYNLNLGFMWILNEDDVNIKTHLTAGVSSYATLVSYYQSRGSGMIYNYESRKDIYLQMRMYATYKPFGICFGMESFIRKTEVPAFNFTLSKAFDLKKLASNLTPVSGLKL